MLRVREKGPGVVEEEGMVGRNGRRRRVSRDRVKLGELGVELGLVERDYGRRWRKSMEAEEARMRGGEE